MSIDYLKIAALVLVPLLFLFVPFYLNRRNAPNWVIRKTIHSVLLTVVAVYGGFLEEMDEILITLAIFLTIAVTFSLIPSIRLLQVMFEMGTREGESQKESFMNTALTIIVSFTLLFVLGDSRMIYMASIFSVAFGDSLGEFIGKPFGKHKYKIIATKSLEGSFGVFVGTLFGVVVTYIIFGQFSFAIAWVLILVALVAMVVEALSFSVIDNLALPTISAALLFYLI